jgi:ArsR family metal-binding transcriptional regulator
MPLYPYAKALIRKNLEALQAGQRVPRVAVGKLTMTQIKAVNASRQTMVYRSVSMKSFL